jgi:hypothetical protein
MTPSSAAIILWFILFFLFLFLTKLKSGVQAQPKVTAASRRRWLGAVGVADGGGTPPLPFVAARMAGPQIGYLCYIGRKLRNF